MGIVLVLGFIILNSSLTSAAEATVCCEKTVSGAWCQNAPVTDCSTAINPKTNQPYKNVPTSCESTSYCQLGTCVDVKNGICMENSAEASCTVEGSEAIWKAGNAEDVPQCQLGCCFIGDQAAFVTSSRCNSLASTYGVPVSYRTDITNEAQCISMAEPDAKGACVYERDYQRTCKFTSRNECQNMQSNSTSSEFYEGLLCTNQDLNTNCAKTEKTTCISSDDSVYYLDSCGNTANIYDSTRYDDLTYWNEVVDKTDSCTLGVDGDSSNCGSCDYFLGTTCGEYRINKDPLRPEQGNNVCRSLGCEFDGKTYEHGETWCGGTDSISSIGSGNIADTNSDKENTPGSQYYRYLCYNGEVTLEPCAAWRSEVCIQSSLPTSDGEEFTTAACRVNRWQDCVSQTSKTECERSDKRDCKWMPISTWKPTDNDNPGIIVQDDETDKYGACVPRYSPGYDYWANGTDAGAACSLASVSCTKTKDRSLFGWFGNNDDDKNLQCGSDAWKNELENVCVAIGDCGSSVSYIGENGYNEWSNAFNN